MLEILVSKLLQENSAILDFASKNNIGNIWTGLLCHGHTISTCIWDIVSGSAESYDNFASGKENFFGRILECFFSNFSEYSILGYPNVSTASCGYFITTGKEAGQWKTGLCNQQNSILCELPPTIYGKNSKQQWAAIAVGQSESWIIGQT